MVLHHCQKETSKRYVLFLLKSYVTLVYLHCSRNVRNAGDLYSNAWQNVLAVFSKTL